MSKISVKEINIVGNYPTNVLVLQNDEIKVAIIPKIGGKMIRLESKRTGINYLLEPHNNKYIQPTYGDIYDLNYGYGFDECFPTVEPCNYIHGKQNIKLPDHGEVWTRPWEFQQDEESILLSIQGVKIDYLFKKQIKLSGAHVIINYTLENRSDDPFDYIWSSHPLLAVEQGDEIHLSSEIDEMLINWASDSDLGRMGDRFSWPTEKLHHQITDWSIIKKENSQIAIKLFTDRLNIGRAAFYKNKVDESLLYSFDTDKIPYLGLWLCYGGWPPNEAKRSHTIALEPTSGRPDSLMNAKARNESSNIPAGQQHHWQLKITVAEGKVSF